MSAALGGTQPSLASRAPWWLISLYVVSTLLALGWAAAWTLALIFGQYQSHPFENYTINYFVWLGSLAGMCVQTLALVGLYTRQSWGRPLATIAAALWLLTGIGLVFAALAWWALYRRWQPGVETTFTREHPSAPAYVVGLAAVGTALILFWLWFLYVDLPNIVSQTAPGLNLYPVFSIALYFSLPLWIVQALTVVGLLQKHDWGAVLAMVTCIVWVLSLFGLPFGVAGLFVLWRWQHPALKPDRERAPLLRHA